jgi:hypothetical protein
MIFLSPTALVTYKKANELLPTKLSNDPLDPMSSRFLSIELHFEGSFIISKGTFQKKRLKKLTTKIIVASIYFPYKDQEYDTLLETILALTSN